MTSLRKRRPTVGRVRYVSNDVAQVCASVMAMPSTDEATRKLLARMVKARNDGKAVGASYYDKAVAYLNGLRIMPGRA